MERHGKTYRFLDTAGIRRKGKTKLVAEKLSVIMARQHLERADVALLVVDASVGVTSHDATIASYAEQSGRSVIIVMNKWDLALEAARRKKPQREKAHGGKEAGKGANPAKLLADYEPMVRQKLKFLAYAPIVFLSALTGERIEKLYTLIDRVAEARRRRISTGELNRWLANVDLDRGHFARQPQGENLLRHAGDRFAADVRPVHQSVQAAALQLPALPRKPAARRFRFHGHADPLHAAPEEARAPKAKSAKSPTRREETQRRADSEKRREKPSATGAKGDPADQALDEG